MLGENDLREQFLFEAALENRDDLHASDEEIKQLGQVEVEDGREIPGSQENDLELSDPERDQAPSVDRPGAFLNKGATPAWARVCGRSPAVPSLKVAPQKCTSSKW